MKNNKELPAFPVDEETTGLTKREHMAGLAMNGILAGMGDTDPFGFLDGASEKVNRIKVVSYQITDKMLE